MRKVTPLKERFEGFVAQIPFSECHFWLGCLGSGGYGKIAAGHRGGERLLAHRVSYELYKGEIPPGMCILHSCDNPMCVNPNHLRVGTNAENMRERAIRGKYKLSKEKVNEIRSDLKNGVRQCDISRATGLSTSYIHMIKIRKTRKYA